MAGGLAGAGTGATAGLLVGAPTGPGEAISVPAGALIGSVAMAGAAGSAAMSTCKSGASTPTGSRSNAMGVGRGTNTPEVINGRQYTGHALDEMQSSGVVPSMVEETIENGTVGPGNTPGTATHTLDGLKVVTNSNGGVVTVIPVRR